jgi:adenylyltransferase/sulfurtransferase
VWYEPPDDSGDEVLRIVSARRSLKLKGRLFREFNRRVRPLLDGTHTMEDIFLETADVFSADDLTSALDMLAGQGILVEGANPAVSTEVAERLTPQLNYFHEMTDGGRALQARLASAKVAVIGLGGAGATTALGLAAAGIGKLICVDPQAVTPSDVYFSPFFRTGNVGDKRAEIFRTHVQSSAPQVDVAALTQPIETEDDIWRTIEGADFVVSCLDDGMLNLATSSIGYACAIAFHGCAWRWTAPTLRSVLSSIRRMGLATCATACVRLPAPAIRRRASSWSVISIA